MCPRCAGKVFRGFSLEKRVSRGKKPSKTLTSSSPLDVSTHSSWRALLADLVLWRQLCDFLVLEDLCQLSACSRPVFNAILCLDWRQLCEKRRHNSSDFIAEVCFSGEPDVYLLMPGLECPSTWRDFYFACHRKCLWLQSIRSAIAGEASFGLGLLEYLRSSSICPEVYEDRSLSKNDVYIVDTHVITIDMLNAELIEHLLNTTYRSKTCTLSSGTVAIMRECGLPNSTRRVVVCTLYPFQSDRGCVSFADLSELIFHKKFLSEGSWGHPRIKNFAMAPAEMVMPYEIYGIEFKVGHFYLIEFTSLPCDNNYAYDNEQYARMWGHEISA